MSEPELLFFEGSWGNIWGPLSFLKDQVYGMAKVLISSIRDYSEKR